MVQVATANHGPGCRHFGPNEGTEIRAAPALLSLIEGSSPSVGTPGQHENVPSKATSGVRRFLLLPKRELTPINKFIRSGHLSFSSLHLAAYSEAHVNTLPSSL